MKLNMISNYKPPGSFQSILIPTLRSKNTYNMQNAKLLAICMYISLLFIVGLVKVLMLLTLQIYRGSSVFWNSFIKVVVVFFIVADNW